MKATKNLLLTAVGFVLMNLTFNDEVTGFWGIACLILGGSITLIGAYLLLRQFIDFIRSIDKENNGKH